jgi:hypothetical protein
LALVLWKGRESRKQKQAEEKLEQKDFTLMTGKIFKRLQHS